MPTSAKRSAARETQSQTYLTSSSEWVSPVSRRMSSRPVAAMASSSRATSSRPSLRRSIRFPLWNPQ